METAGIVVAWGLGLGISLYAGKKLIAYLEEKVSEYKVEKLIREIQQEQQGQSVNLTLSVVSESWPVTVEEIAC